MLGFENYITGTISLVINNDEQLEKHFVSLGMQLREQDIRRGVVVGAMIRNIQGYFPKSHPMFHDEQWELHKAYDGINWEELAEAMLRKASERERYLRECDRQSKGELYDCGCKYIANQDINEHYAAVVDEDGEHLYQLMIDHEMDVNDVIEAYAVELSERVRDVIVTPEASGYGKMAAIAMELALTAFNLVDWRGQAEGHVEHAIQNWRADDLLVEIAEACGVYMPDMEVEDAA